MGEAARCHGTGIALSEHLGNLYVGRSACNTRIYTVEPYLICLPLRCKPLVSLNGGGVCRYEERSGAD